MTYWAFRIRSKAVTSPTSPSTRTYFPTSDAGSTRQACSGGTATAAAKEALPPPDVLLVGGVSAAAPPAAPSSVLVASCLLEEYIAGVHWLSQLFSPVMPSSSLSLWNSCEKICEGFA